MASSNVSLKPIYKAQEIDEVYSALEHDKRIEFLEDQSHQIRKILTENDLSNDYIWANVFIFLRTVLEIHNQKKTQFRHQLVENIKVKQNLKV